MQNSEIFHNNIEIQLMNYIISPFMLNKMAMISFLFTVGPIWSPSTDLTPRKKKLKACRLYIQTTSTNYPAEMKRAQGRSTQSKSYG